MLLIVLKREGVLMIRLPVDGQGLMAEATYSREIICSAGAVGRPAADEKSTAKAVINAVRYFILEN
jgi:hypothetical protein